MKGLRHRGLIWENGIDEPRRSASGPVMARRAVLSLPLGVAASQGLAQLEQMRLRLGVPQGAAPQRALEHWEQEVHQLGVRIRLQDPDAFLSDAAGVLRQLCELFEGRSAVDTQRRIGVMIARLAGLIAIDCNATANTRHMQSWFHIAQSLAHECDDPATGSWAIAYEAMSHLWHGQNLNRAADLAHRARSLAPAAAPSGPLAAAIEGRALARMGRAEDALACIDSAETLWRRLSEADAEQNTFGFYEHLLRMYQSDVYTVLGRDFDRAYEVQARAVDLAPAGPLDVDTALVRLDSAICLAKQKELSQSSYVAMDIIRQVPQGFRKGTAAQKAWTVVGLISHHGAGNLARDMQEMLEECL
jgi:tetratricopeptide (TPR) repeat protein